MAKRKQTTRRGGNARTKDNEKSGIVRIVALILAVLAVAYVITSLALGGMWNPIKWTSKKTSTDTTSKQSWGGVIDNVGNKMDSETTYAMPAAMAFYAISSPELAEQYGRSAPAVTVSCSHNFEFNNVYVDWSVEYPSGASASDVVTVTPTSDGSLTANITCLGAFAEPLTLKATLRGNSEKTATCKIDYVKRINMIDNISIQGTDFDEQAGVTFNTYFNPGTVIGDMYIYDLHFNLTNEFWAQLKSYLKFDIAYKSFSMKDISVPIYKEGYLNQYLKDFDFDWEYSIFIENFDDYDEAHKNAIYYAWYMAYLSCCRSDDDMYNQGNIELEIGFELRYNGVLIDSRYESEYITPFNFLSGEGFGYDLAPDLTLNGNVAL